MKDARESTRGTRAAVLGLALLVLWVLFAWTLAPRWVAAAYREESVPFLNRMLSGRATHPLDYYMGMWRALAVRVTQFGALLWGVGFAGFRFRSFIFSCIRRLADTCRATPASPRQTLAFGVWSGAAAGFLEAVTVGIRQLADPNPAWIHSWDVFWMAPLAGAALFLFVGFILSGASRFWVGFLGWPLLVAATLGVAIYTVARSAELGIAPWAACILALGVGSAGSDLWAHDVARGAPSLLRRVSWVPALILAIALGFQGSEVLGTARGLSGLPEAAGGPNVLLIILDTVRSQNLGLYGYGRPTTPELSEFAKQGAVFEQAFAPSPWTLPSHAALFTGRSHHETSVGWESPMEEGFPTLAEALGAIGYESAGFVGNAVFASTLTGLDRGFQRYVDRPPTLATVVQNFRPTRWLSAVLTGRAAEEMPNMDASRINSKFLEWLDGRASERPYFAFLNYFDAHDPYRPPAPFDRLFTEPGTDSNGRWPTNPTVSPVGVDEQTRRDLRDLYDGAIAYLDSELGRLFRAMEERGALENTLVIITSDHGEQFGEQDPRLNQHGNSLNSAVLSVPLVMVLRGRIPEGVRVTSSVGIQDVPATVIDIVAGGEDPGFPGSSLREAWRFPDPADRLILSALAERPWPDPRRRADFSLSLLHGSLHFVRPGAEPEVMFDVGDDPFELTDLSGSPRHRDALEAFRQEADRVLDQIHWVESEADPRSREIEAASR